MQLNLMIIQQIYLYKKSSQRCDNWIKTKHSLNKVKFKNCTVQVYQLKHKFSTDAI